MADRNRFSRLHYLRCSETYFRFVTTVIKLSPTSSCHQRVLQKLNNIIISRFTTENRPHIISDLWRFNTTAAWKMLGEDFDKWPVIPIADDVLDGLEIHLTSLGYLEDGPPRFVELLDGGTEEENRQLMELD